MSQNSLQPIDSKGVRRHLGSTDHEGRCLFSITYGDFEESFMFSSKIVILGCVCKLLNLQQKYPFLARTGTGRNIRVTFKEYDFFGILV